MALNNQTPVFRMDGLKWLLVLLLLAAGIFSNHYFAEVAWSLRAAAGIVLACLLLAVLYQTAKGRAAWSFIKEARSELRKVSWPTRRETIQTTMLVIVMVLVTAFVLWAVDSLFMWFVGWIMGQRG